MRPRSLTLQMSSRHDGLTLRRQLGEKERREQYVSVLYVTAILTVERKPDQEGLPINKCNRNQAHPEIARELGQSGRSQNQEAGRRAEGYDG